MGNLPRCEATKKVMFLTQTDAKSSIHKNKEIRSRKSGQRVNRLRRKRKETRAYHCEYCGCWHLTSQSFQERKRRKQKKDLDNSEQ